MLCCLWPGEAALHLMSPRPLCVIQGSCDTMQTFPQIRECGSHQRRAPSGPGAPIQSRVGEHLRAKGRSYYLSELRRSVHLNLSKIRAQSVLALSLPLQPFGFCRHFLPSNILGGKYELGNCHPFPSGVLLSTFPEPGCEAWSCPLLPEDRRSQAFSKTSHSLYL